MNSVAFVILDTNVLLQCKSLAELPWRTIPQFADHEEIILLICHPVLAELDKHKYRTEDRAGRRARKYHQILRQLIQQKTATHEIRQHSPSIALAEITDLQPTPEFLDYSITDHRILGCVRRYLDSYPDRTTLFLTNDVAAAATARNTGIPFVIAPDDWRLPPEQTKYEKQNSALKKENERLRKAEPAFQIDLTDRDLESLDPIRLQYNVIQPLSTAEVNELISLITRRIPAVLAQPYTVVDPSSYPEQSGDPIETFRSVAALAAFRGDFIGDDEIDSSTYARWVQDCEQDLRQIHLQLQRLEERAPLSVVVSNVGTRPAKDALVEFKAHGHLQIWVPPRKNSVWYRRENHVRLPAPPKRGVAGFRDRIRNQLLDSAATLVDREDDRDGRDPNAFYYKPSRPREPVTSFALECRQWRHGAVKRSFEFEPYVREGTGIESGGVSCTIHAENLSNPFRKLFRLEVTCNAVSAFDSAKALVSKLEKS